MQFFLLVIAQLPQVIVTAGMADVVNVCDRDPLKVLCHHLCEIIAVHLHQGRRGINVRFRQLFLATPKHLLHEPLGKARISGQCHAVKPGMGNMECGIEKQTPGNSHTKGRAVYKCDLRAVVLKQKCTQSVVLFICGNIGARLSVPSLIRGNNMIGASKIRLHQLIQVSSGNHHRCEKNDGWIAPVAILVNKHI